MTALIALKEARKAQWDLLVQLREQCEDEPSLLPALFSAIDAVGAFDRAIEEVSKQSIVIGSPTHPDIVWQGGYSGDVRIAPCLTELAQKHHKIDTGKTSTNVLSDDEKSETETAFYTLQNAIRTDDDYAWSWLCNLAMACIDNGANHKKGNETAALIMDRIFGVDLTETDQWKTLSIDWENEDD